MFTLYSVQTHIQAVRVTLTCIVPMNTPKFDETEDGDRKLLFDVLCCML